MSSDDIGEGLLTGLVSPQPRTNTAATLRAESPMATPRSSMRFAPMSTPEEVFAPPANQQPAFGQFRLISGDAPLPTGVDGDHGGGDAEGDAPRAALNAPPPTAHHLETDTASADKDDESNDAGFVAYKSTSAKKREKKAARDAGAGVTDGQRTAPAQSRRPAKIETPTTQRSDAPVRELTAGTRRKPTALERKFYLLLECLREGASATTVVEAFAQLQREVRTAADENAMQFTNVYAADQEEDCTALHELLRGWLVGPKDTDTIQLSATFNRQRKTIWIPDLVKRMKHFRLQVAHEPERQPKNAWLRDLTRDPSHDESPDGDANMAAPPPKPTIRCDRTAALSNAAAQHLQQALAAHGGQPVLSHEITAQLSLTTHAYVATAIAAATHGQLVVQLPGGIRIDAAATYADLLALIDGHTPTMIEAARRFKSALVGAVQDPASNRLVFKLVSKPLAEEWAGEQLAIKRRLVVLKRPRTADTHVGDCSLDPETYEITVCNLGGTLSYLNIWHLFHSLLRLDVVDISQAPADAAGLVDPTRWIIVIKSRGCPARLLGKTRIARKTENVWIHHTAFAGQPPCTRCDHADHTASKCPDAKAKHPTAVISVDGPLLDISDASARLAQQDSRSIQATLQDQEIQLREQSMMGGEDRPAPEHTGVAHPVGPPLVIPEATRVNRPRLWRRICEFARTQIVRKLLRLRELAAASDEWRLEAHSYRGQPQQGATRPPEDDNDHLVATLRLFQVIAARPVPESTKPEIKDVETDAREKLNWPEDLEVRDAISRKWAIIKAQVGQSLAKERRRIRIGRRKEERAKAAATAARHNANAHLPFMSALQQAAEQARQAAQQTLVPFDSVLQRAAQAVAATDTEHHDQTDDGFACGQGEETEELPENMDLTGAPTGILVA